MPPGQKAHACGGSRKTELKLASHEQMQNDAEGHVTYSKF